MEIVESILFRSSQNMITNLSQFVNFIKKVLCQCIIIIIIDIYISLNCRPFFFFFAEPNLCKGGKGSLEQKPSTSDDNLAET